MSSSGPRRARSVDSYGRRARVAGIVALSVLAGGVVSDTTAPSFWSRHALLAGLVASLIVVMLSVAVLSEVVERRRRERWSILAQYVMFELVRNARMIWSGVLDVAGLLPTHPNQLVDLEGGARAVRDTPRLTSALRTILDDDDGRRPDAHRDRLPRRARRRGDGSLGHGDARPPSRRVADM
jgi:hypothetical protein